MALEELLAESRRCNRCGYCQPPCPVFQATGVESSSGRGRIQLLRAAAEGRAEFSRDFGPALFECLLCRACVEACAPGAETDRVVAAGRAEWFTRWGRTPVTDLIFRGLLPHRARMEAAARAAFLGIHTGAARAADVLGLLRLQPRAAAAVAWVGQPPREFLTARLARLHLSQAGARLRIGYFVSCGMDLLAPGAGEATVRLLGALGCEVVPLGNACCGLPAYVYGDREAAACLLRQAADTFHDSGPLDAVVTDCGSCSSHLRHGAELLGLGEPGLGILTDLTRDLGEFVHSTGAMPEHPVPLRVTYHDPCHLSRHQDLTLPPRELLSSVPALDYREMREAAWCCGGAGAYGIEHQGISRSILARKIGNARETEATVVVTACPACITQLAFGARDSGTPVRVAHLSEVLATAYGVGLDAALVESSAGATARGGQPA